MTIKNNITDPSYIQWVEKFVTDAIIHAGLTPQEVIIDDFEFSRNIFLRIDNEEYDIRTWNFEAIAIDKNRKTCAELIRYSLYKIIQDEHGSHGEEIYYGEERIEWKN